MRDVTCRYHPHAPASYECSGCHKRYCSQCVKELSGEYYCKVCEKRLKEEWTKERKAAKLMGTSLYGQLLEHLSDIGVEGDLVEYELSSEPATETGLMRISTKRKTIPMIRLAGQDIDGVWVEDLSSGSLGLSEYWVHYLLFSHIGHELLELAEGISAKTKKTTEHRFWGKVRDVAWVGGPIIQSLNQDIELSPLLIQGGQTSIQIRTNPMKQEVDILSIVRKLEFSRESFIAFNRIAKHIRNYLASHAGKAKTDVRDVYKRPW